MAHETPWVLKIGAVVSLAVLADDETWCSALDSQVDDGLRVGHRLNAVGVSVGGELDCAVVGVERGLVIAEVGVLELIGAPEVWLRLAWVEDLCVELAGGANSTVYLSVIALGHRSRAVTYTTLL